MRLTEYISIRYHESQIRYVTLTRQSCHMSLSQLNWWTLERQLALHLQRRRILETGTPCKINTVFNFRRFYILQCTSGLDNFSVGYSNGLGCGSPLGYPRDSPSLAVGHHLVAVVVSCGRRSFRLLCFSFSLLSSPQFHFHWNSSAQINLNDHRLGGWRDADSVDDAKFWCGGHGALGLWFFSPG